MSKTFELDAQTRQACLVANHDYFDIARESRNEIQGLMIGTAVKKLGDPISVPSKYWGGKPYWSVKVECPNGEIKTIGCDALAPRKTAKPFNAQRRAFGYKFGKK